jgi:hypothetical protein
MEKFEETKMAIEGVNQRRTDNRMVKRTFSRFDLFQKGIWALFSRSAI